jgi:hypothetical protein
MRLLLMQIFTKGAPCHVLGDDTEYWWLLACCNKLEKKH